MEGSSRSAASPDGGGTEADGEEDKPGPKKPTKPKTPRVKTKTTTKTKAKTEPETEPKTKVKRAPRKKPDPEPDGEPLDVDHPLYKVEAQLRFADRVFTNDLGGDPLPPWVPEPTGHEPPEPDSKPPRTGSGQEGSP